MEGYSSDLRGQYAKLIDRNRCRGLNPLPSAKPKRERVFESKH